MLFGTDVCLSFLINSLLNMINFSSNMKKNLLKLIQSQTVVIFDFITSTGLPYYKYISSQFSFQVP